MSIRSISINPSDLSIKSKKDKKTKKMTQLSEPITINSTNIRKMLLEKLKQHKKTQKNILLNKDNFDNKVPNYSNLKNGTKPTFREWKQTNPIPICPNPIPICPMNDIPIHLDEVDVFDMASKDPYIQEREVKKTFKLGKNLKNKTISILIKSNKTRKNIDQLKRELKNTKLNTIKNFLKTKNLIKFGTSSPSGLLKEIYESSKLCGDVYNNNAKTLIHNYNINNDS